MPITVFSFSEVITAPIVTASKDELQLGRQYYASKVKLFMKKNTMPIAKVSTNGNIFQLANTTISTALNNTLLTIQPQNEEIYLNAYGEIITPDLSGVTPFVTGVFKDVVQNYASIQRDGLNTENFIVVGFPDGKFYNISKFNLPGIFIGALPKFKIKLFLKYYPESNFTWESLQYLMEQGLFSGLEGFINTIGILDVKFTSSHISLMRMANAE